MPSERQNIKVELNSIVVFFLLFISSQFLYIFPSQTKNATARTWCVLITVLSCLAVSPSSPELYFRCAQSPPKARNTMDCTAFAD